MRSKGEGNSLMPRVNYLWLLCQLNYYIWIIKKKKKKGKGWRESPRMEGIGIGWVNLWYKAWIWASLILFKGPIPNQVVHYPLPKPLLLFFFFFYFKYILIGDINILPTNQSFPFFFFLANFFLFFYLLLTSKSHIPKKKKKNHIEK